MIELSAAEIAAITGGVLLGAAADNPTLSVNAVAVDSRDISSGALFVAKPGEFSDGHRFVPQAFSAGAVLALVERAVPDETGADYPAVLVPDVVLAMGALAADVVRRLRAAGPLTVVGITGSAGKTTTKDLLAGILAAQAPTVAPVGSYNGEVGVPLTVFTADFATRYLIIEMGATGIGHIAYLAHLVRPDVGVVLGVGSAHAGEFGGVENIAVAKGELVEALAPAGTAILNADDDRVLAMRSRTAAQIVLCTAADGFDGGSADSARGSAVVRAGNLQTNQAGHPEFNLTLPDETSTQISSRLIGSHHVPNLLASAAAAYVLAVPVQAIADSLNSQGPASRWRMERTERPDGVTVINDAYNANPESMRAALRTLAELGRSRRTWAVLGAMLELGESTVEEHDAVGRTVVRLNISRLVVVGAGAKAMHTGAVLEGSWGDEAVFVPDADAAEALLRAELRTGDLVLFKSSNSAGLRILGDRIALPTDNVASVPTAAEPKADPGKTTQKGSSQL